MRLLRQLVRGPRPIRKTTGYPEPRRCECSDQQSTCIRLLRQPEAIERSGAANGGRWQCSSHSHEAARNLDAGFGESARVHAGILQFPQEYVAAVRSDGTILAPVGSLPGESVAARPNETIMLFGTGFGPTLPATLPNQVVTEPVPTANPVKVQIHNQQAAVTFAGLTSAGLYQINITVPDLADGDYPITAEVGGVRTAKFARLRIQRQSSAAEGSQVCDRKSYLALIRKIRKGLAPVPPNAML